MTKVDILTDRQFLNTADLQKIFDCGTCTAQRIMREIKAKSDIAKLKGKVTVTDYEAWYNGKCQEAQ
ncbi:MAG: hypothetical protein K2L12_06430 [Clostridia bacterium]|nr:hypothetical protein [Clostridia bacterium]